MLPNRRRVRWLGRCTASFFGDLHGQGRDAVGFFTPEKVVIERWTKKWTRRF
jgi:hypothetical protein